MTRKQIGAVCGAVLLAVIAPLLVLALLHGSGGTAQAQPPPSYTKVSMPDFGQHSQSWCWVGAAANSFWWYAENVTGQEGLLGGPLKPWKSIDPNSQAPGDPCWYDANDLPQGYGGPLPIPGYRQVLSMIAQTTFMDANQNGIQEAGEASYCYNQGVEKWDYLIGLRDYVNNYGSSLTVHDIIDPAKCGVGAGMIPTRQFPPTMNSLDPCGPGGAGVPGVNQVVLPPTFLDYQTELSNSQDVLLWMESTSPETAHVVTGVGYDTAPNPDTITISDPWTRNANPPVAPHDDTWNVSDPSHNNAPGHVPSPYDVCTVVNPGPAPKFTINCSGTIWTVYDMIFVSPATGADIKVLTFYSDPPGPFTFDVSTYNVINLIEDKHNNGPLDALVDVSWTMDPIEDRDGDGIPDINVRWEAEINDICTYQGAFVPCGEGDGVGTGGSGDGNPSLTGDNCQDDADNDGDGTCDINGCTAYPGMGDPDCQVDIDDIHFQIFLPQSVETPVNRELKMHCKPRSDPYPYTLTLYNEEWPVEVEDPFPENNFQVLDIDVTCQVADPHYKIYDIFDPTGLPVDEYVALEDQFHTQDNVLVTYPATLLPPAIKYVEGLYAGGGTAAPHLKCYQIEGMPPADATVNLTTQFGTETDIYVDMAGWLCVTALKEVTYPEPLPPPPPPVPLEPHYVCYDIWPALTPPPGLNIELETQFGIESGMTWEASGALCAPVIKRDNATGEYLGGNLTAPHLRCYAMSSPDDPPHIVNLFTQFPDEYDVDVNFPMAMCVPAEKEIVGPDEADVKILSQTIYAEDCMSDPPTDIDVSEDVVICVDKVLHNNGPYTPVNVDIAKTASAPAGCTILPLGPPEQVLLENSTTVSHQEWFTIHCDEASTHGPFTVDNFISIKDPGVTDPDPLNNTASSTLWVNAWANANVKIMSHQILDDDCVSPPPASMAVSENVDVCVRKVLHNNGPYGPVTVHVAKTAYADAGADIDPPSGSAQLLLDMSVVRVHDEIFTIHCSTPGLHSFTVDNDVDVKDEHVEDYGGASASDTIWVDCSEGLEADSKVVGAGVYDYLGKDRDTSDPDLDLWDTDNVIIELVSEEHNNGPNEAMSRFTFLADVPLGCGGEWLNEVDTYRPFDPAYPIDQLVGFGPTPGIKDPGDGNPNTAESVAVSPLMPEPVSIIIPWVEQFDLHCLTEGTYVFTFCNKQEVEPPYVDPNLLNSFQCFTMNVTSADCTPGVDTDGDTFNDDVECYLPTDQVDDCPDVIGADDAWPLDINMDTYVTVVGDVLAYAGRVGAWGGPPPDPNWMQRLDLNADNWITVVGDVLAFSGKVGSNC